MDLISPKLTKAFDGFFAMIMVYVVLTSTNLSRQNNINSKIYFLIFSVVLSIAYFIFQTKRKPKEIGKLSYTLISIFYTLLGILCFADPLYILIFIPIFLVIFVVLNIYKHR